MRLWYLSHRWPAKAQASLHSLARAFAFRTHEVDKGSDQKSDIWPHWMAVHTHLKNEFTEEEKYHNLMTLLKRSKNETFHIRCYFGLYLKDSKKYCKIV